MERFFPWVLVLQLFLKTHCVRLFVTSLIRLDLLLIPYVGSGSQSQHDLWLLHIHLISPFIHLISLFILSFHTLNLIYFLFLHLCQLLIQFINLFPFLFIVFAFKLTWVPWYFSYILDHARSYLCHRTLKANLILVIALLLVLAVAQWYILSHLLHMLISYTISIAFLTYFTIAKDSQLRIHCTTSFRNKLCLKSLLKEASWHLIIELS